MGRQIAAGTLPKPNDDDEAAKYEIADDLPAAAGLEWRRSPTGLAPDTKASTTSLLARNVDWAGLGRAHSHYNAVTEADHPQSALGADSPAGGGKSEAIASGLS